MKRNEIMEKCPDEFEDEMKDILDYFEDKFNTIASTLDVAGVGQLGQIEEAYDLAKEIARDLY